MINEIARSVNAAPATDFEVAKIYAASSLMNLILKVLDGLDVVSNICGRGIHSLPNDLVGEPYNKAINGDLRGVFYGAKRMRQLLEVGGETLS